MVLTILADVGNPASLHGHGRRAERRVEAARAQVAALVGRKAREVVFTVEYSVRGAMRAVYGLLGVDREIPPVRLALEKPGEALPALRAALG